VGNTILVVDDEPNIVELVKFNLENSGYQVLVAITGLEAMDMVKNHMISLVILDIMLPGIDGLEVCKRIRSMSKIPILMLSAKTSELDRVLGLELGADDYLTKPFSPRELIARVKAILRRMDEKEEVDTVNHVKYETIIYKNLKLIPDQHRVLVEGEEIELTLTEYQLLEILIKAPGRVFSREFLIEVIWGTTYYGDTRTVDVHIRHLREKIEKDPSNPEYIMTVRGVGYKFKEKN
jgi:DNA-binding response OmpR family regulator